MDPDRHSALGRAGTRATQALKSFGRMPGALRLAYVAIPVMVLGTLMPWIDFDVGDASALGVETMPGGLTIAIAAVVGFLLAPRASERTLGVSGGVAALALLALAILGAQLLHLVLEDTSPGYGLYVSLVAALGLFAAGVLLYGAAPPGSRPPEGSGRGPLPPPD
jgi:hypothetical protein